MERALGAAFSELLDDALLQLVFGDAVLQLAQSEPDEDPFERLDADFEVVFELDVFEEFGEEVELQVSQFEVEDAFDQVESFDDLELAVLLHARDVW